MTRIDAAERRRHLDPNGESPAVIELITAHRTLAHRLARRYTRTAELADLEQVADTALLLAARRYDPTAGPFRRYAVITVIGELKKHLRRTGWNAHVPRRAQEDALTVQAAIDRLTTELARPPRMSELAAATGLTSERVYEAMHAHGARYSSSPDALEQRPVADDPYEAVDEGLQVRRAVGRLEPRDRELIALTYEHGLSQRMVGERLDISQSQVQRRLRTVLETLGRQLDRAEG